MKTADKGIPAINLPSKKDSTTINLMGGLSSGQAKSKRAGISVELPKK
jgi:hypothetical protein